MGLLDLLRNAGGEVSLRSSLGRWYLAVSQLLDQAAAASSPSFIHSKNSSAQNSVGANTNIVVDQDINVRGITRPSSTAFQLEAGKTYHLIAHLTANTFSSGATGEIRFRWVDDNNANIPGPTSPDATAAVAIPTTGTGGEVADPIAEVIYTVPTGSVAKTQVKLRCTSSVGTATIPSNGVCVTIVEIPG